MTYSELSLIHIARKPRRESEGRPPLLLLLHGLGSHEGDLMGLASYLDDRFFVIAARGPLTLEPGSYAWFQVQFVQPTPVANFAEVESSRLALLRFIDEAVERYELDPERVYLMGFSQGAIMASCIALTEPEKVAGVVAMSGRILEEIQPLMSPPEALAGLPFLVVHGIYDTVLPIDHGRASRDLLAGLPVQLSYQEYPIAHEVSAESLEDVAGWLRARLG